MQTKEQAITDSLDRFDYTAVFISKDQVSIIPLVSIVTNNNKYKKQLLKIERKVGMEYQKAYKQG